MNMPRTVTIAAAAIALLLAGAPARAADDIVATAEKAGSFKTLITAIKAAGLTETLKGKGPLTVFAPSDDAFKKLPADTLDKLLKPESKDALAAILKFHVLSGRYSADRLQKARARQFTVRTAQGTPVLFDKKDGLTIAGAKLAKTDIGASNGTIHIIDTVLLPASVRKALASAAPAAATPTVQPAAAKDSAPAAPTPAAPAASIPAPAGQPAAPKATIPAIPAGPKK